MMMIGGRQLPQYSKMIVTGQPVEVEQAKDIIMKTDQFLTSTSIYSGCERLNFNNGYREYSGLNYARENFDDYFYSYIKEELGLIKTTYIENDWASSSKFLGPNGWCHPDGQIFFSGEIGPWPTDEKLLAEWKMIAEAFPYLNLSATYMVSTEMIIDQWLEYDMPLDRSLRPAFNIRVLEGKAEITKADLTAHPKGPRYTDSILDINLIKKSLERNPIYLNREWYKEFGDIVRGVVDRYKEILAERDEEAKQRNIHKRGEIYTTQFIDGNFDPKPIKDDKEKLLNDYVPPKWEDPEPDDQNSFDIIFLDGELKPA